jgi:hypothetical protein
MNSSLLAGLVGLILPALLDWLSARFERASKEALARREGAQAAQAEIAKESENAKKRMHQANADPVDRASLIDRLRSGGA